MPENHERFKIDPASHFAFRSRKAIPALDGFSFIPPDCPERKGVFSKLGAKSAREVSLRMNTNPHSSQQPLEWATRPATLRKAGEGTGHNASVLMDAGRD
jgi:hypothetical protein